MSRWTLFWKSSAQGSWVFRPNPTILKMSIIALRMEMRGIPWCTWLKYKKGRTVRNMQMKSGRIPQSLRDKILTRGGITLRPPDWCVKWKCMFTARGKLCQWTVGFCESGNPPLARERCVWAIYHQEAKVLAEGVPQGTYWQLHGC